MEDDLGIDPQLLVETFLAEADEGLAAMEQALLAIEASPHDEELLNTLFRGAHTMKGSSSLVGFFAIRDLAHEMESLMELVRSHTLPVTSALVTLLLQAVDGLREATVAAAAGRTERFPLGEAIQARLRQATREAVVGGGAVQTEAAAQALPFAPPPAVVPQGAIDGRTLRVDVNKLDRMADLSGEIAIARGRFANMLERGAARSLEEILEAHREADRLHLDLQELIMKARMVPLGPVFRQHLRTVRDLALAQGKKAALLIEGADTEVDTAIVEHLRDPLTHMVRNALDHGIEAPEERRAAGKDPTGRLVLRAAHEGSNVVVQITDDGAGLPRQRIAERAQALGLVLDADQVSDEQVARLVFEPRVSTSEAVTEVSGRGVGLDVVRRNVEALAGSVTVDSVEGKGTTITIRLPLTLAVIQGFRVGVGGETFILPLDKVRECLELPAEEHAKEEGSGVINLRGHPLPYLRLRKHLALGGGSPQREHVVVVQHGNATAGLAVDALLGESQSVIKPLGRAIQGLPAIAGSSILGDGRVALILDIAGLLREALARVAAA